MNRFLALLLVIPTIGFTAANMPDEKLSVSTYKRRLEPRMEYIASTPENILGGIPYTAQEYDISDIFPNYAASPGLVSVSIISPKIYNRSPVMYSPMGHKRVAFVHMSPVADDEEIRGKASPAVFMVALNSVKRNQVAPIEYCEFPQSVVPVIAYSPKKCAESFEKMFLGLGPMSPRSGK